MPSFEITAYTGAVMNIVGFYNPVIVDLSGLKAARDKIPILLDHETSQVVGQTDGIRIDASGVRLSGVITGDDDASRTVVTHAKNGFEWQASIGADVVRQEYLKPGEKAVVNGREVSGPLVIAREARLFETSFVAIGADSQTTANVAASIPPGPSLKGEIAMEFSQWLAAKGFDPSALSDPQRAYLQAQYHEETARAAGVGTNGTGNGAATTTLAVTGGAGAGAGAGNGNGNNGSGGASPDPTTRLNEMLAARKRDNDRRDAINRIAQEAIDERPWLTAEVGDLARAAHDSGASEDDFDRVILRLRASAGTARINRQNAEVGDRIVEATVARTLNMPDIEKHYDVQTLELSERHFRHGTSLKELLVSAARANGYTGHSTNDYQTIVAHAFNRGGGRQAIRANDGFSTLSLPGIMSNVMNKFLVQAFMAVEASWRAISAIRSMRDFRASHSYSLTGDMTFDKLPPNGEFKHGQLGEIAYSNQVETYGKMFAIGRTDIINDDLGALQDIPRRLGRGAALALNLVFWTEFLADVTAFFTVGRGNVNTGAGSALGFSGLTDAEDLFLQQTDADGQPLGIEPRILLVPSALKNTATELMSSQFVNTGGASTLAQVPNENVWRNRFRVVSSTYLQSAKVPNHSTSQWFLLADPQDLPVIEVAFLNGRETPIIEQTDADFNTLGIQFRGYHDFGAATQEYRAGVRSVGS